MMTGATLIPHLVRLIVDIYFYFYLFTFISRIGSFVILTFYLSGTIFHHHILTPGKVQKYYMYLDKLYK